VDELVAPDWANCDHLKCPNCRETVDTFEHLELTPYSAPPDLPDVMKSQEANGQEQSS
jgi:hypothetical protein